MGKEDEPRVVLNTPRSLKPEDLNKLTSWLRDDMDGVERPEVPISERKFLGADVEFFANELYVGFVIRWGMEATGWGEVCFSHSLKDNVDARTGHVWSRKGDWRFDSEHMSEEFVTMLLRFAAPEIARQWMQMEAGTWKPAPPEENDVRL